MIKFNRVVCGSFDEVVLQKEWAFLLISLDIIHCFLQWSRDFLGKEAVWEDRILRVSSDALSNQPVAAIRKEKSRQFSFGFDNCILLEKCWNSSQFLEWFDFALNSFSHIHCRTEVVRMAWRCPVLSTVAFSVFSKKCETIIYLYSRKYMSEYHTCMFWTWKYVYTYISQIHIYIYIQHISIYF